MENRTALLLTIGVASAGFVVGLLVSPSNSGAATDRVMAADDTATAFPDSHAAALTSAPAAFDRREPIAPARAREPVAVGECPPTPAPPAQAAKAADKPPEDLMALPESVLLEMYWKRDKLQDELRRKSAPIIRQRIQEGLTEHVSDERTWSGGDTEAERAMIYGLTNKSGNGWDRAVLPRWQYPELYQYKDEVLRLDKLIAETVAQDAAKKKAR